MIYVLDCSFCAALFLPHEKSTAVKDLFNKIADSEVFVPAQFWDEMTELLITALKRKRLKHADALEINRLLGMYDFNTDASFERDHIERIVDLAGLYELSAAEASYLELAARKRALLGSLNGSLKAACQKAGITVLL